MGLITTGDSSHLRHFLPLHNALCTRVVTYSVVHFTVGIRRDVLLRIVLSVVCFLSSIFWQTFSGLAIVFLSG